MIAINIKRDEYFQDHVVDMSSHMVLAKGGLEEYSVMFSWLIF